MGLELRASLRALVRNWGTSCLVAGAVAIGVGTVTGIFTVADAVLLEPLTFRHPDRVVQLLDRLPPGSAGSEGVPLSFPNFIDYANASSFQSVVGLATTEIYVSGPGGVTQTTGAYFSSGLLTMMGVRTELGRAFRDEEDRVGGPPSALLSNDFWHRWAGGARDVVGRTLPITHFVEGAGWQEVDVQVVGVLPSGFALPPLITDGEYRASGAPEVYLPLGMRTWGRGSRGLRGLRAIAELRADVSLDQAREELRGVASGIGASNADLRGYSVDLVPLNEARARQFGPTLFALFAASVLILLVACANIAGILLSRGVVREQQVAIRTALGASRARIFSQLLFEGVVLGGVGLTGALLIGDLVRNLLRGLLPVDAPGLDRAIPGTEAALFAALLCLVAVLAFGVGPALRMARAGPASRLHEKKSGVRPDVMRTIRYLVVGQVAMTVTLLSGAGLLIRSLDRLLAVDPGFRAAGLLRVALDMPPLQLSKYQSAEAYMALFQRVQEAVEALPQVAVVGGSASRDGPFSGPVLPTDITLADRPTPLPGARLTVASHSVSYGYMEALGFPLLSGRFLRADETMSAVPDANPRGPAPVVVNQRMASQFWPGEDALGKRFYWGIQDPAVVEATLGSRDRSDAWDRRYIPPIPLEVVGVVGDVVDVGLEQRAPAAYYSLWPFTLAELYVRLASPLGVPSGAVRETIVAIDPELRVSEIAEMREVIRDATANTRFRASLFAGFASIALGLAAMGLFGALSYATSLRMREMAVRISVGAQRMQVARLIATEGLRLGAAGAALGLVLSLLTTRLLSHFLYGVSSTDPMILGAAVALILVVSVAASCQPVLRVRRMDPMRLLKED